MAKMIIKYKIFIIIIIILFVSLPMFFIFTATGSSFLVKFTLSKYLGAENINIQKIEGSLASKMALKNISIERLKALPPKSKIRIQKLDVYFTSFNARGLNIEIFNGSVELADSLPIFFYGTYQNGSLDINAYSKDVSVRNTLDIFTDSTELKKISGRVESLDVYVKGSFSEPELNGNFNIDNLLRNGFSMFNCPGSFNIGLKNIKKRHDIFGEIIFEKGLISGPKTALVEIQESKIAFKGNPKKPSLDIKGKAKVEGVKINITLNGTIDDPNLKLTSEPPIPQENLLVMLATGKSWKGTEAALSRGQISADVTKDFVDYFVFGGSGSKLMQAFGLKDISLTLEKQRKGVGVTKSISEKVDATYAVEQSEAEEGEPATTQIVGGEYKITDKVSVGAERELKQNHKPESVQDEMQKNDKVFLKYKKKF